MGVVMGGVGVGDVLGVGDEAGVVGVKDMLIVDPPSLSQ